MIYIYIVFCIFFFFFQAEDGIRDRDVTGVQTCALPISALPDCRQGPWSSNVGGPRGSRRRPRPLLHRQGRCDSDSRGRLRSAAPPWDGGRSILPFLPVPGHLGNRTEHPVMGLSILTLARTLPVHVRGGMEEVSWKLAKALARSGAEETILTTATEGTERIWEEDGVVVHELAYVPLRLQGKPWYRWWPYFAGAVARYSRRLASPPDLIHSQSFYSEGILKQPRHPPVVLTVHGTALGDYEGVTKDKLVREVGPFHPRVLYQRLAVRRRFTTERKELARAAAIVPVSTIVEIGRAHV